MNVVEVVRGDGPVILGQPHGGTHVPDAIAARLNAIGRALADTDWHIARLYQGLLLTATVVRSNVHRYVIDANRDPSGASLYPGLNTTGLCPLTDFDGQDIWREGQAPTGDEVAERCEAYHAPYHAALAEEIARVKARHRCAVLYDCHSIRSRIPFLFEGTLPVFSIGTNDGASCAARMQCAAADPCLNAEGMDTVVNGRFKGGWTTRRYGRPDENVHAVQMELAQRAYLEAEAAPWTYSRDAAEPTCAVLGAALANLDRLARSGELL